MKSKDVFELSLKNIKGNKRINIIYTIVLIILLLLGHISINFNYNMNKYIDDVINKDLSARTLMVHKIDEETNKLYESKALKKELEVFDNIEYIYNDNYDRINAKIFLDNKEIYLSILPINEKMELGIVKGNKIKGDADIICSLTLSPINNNKTSELIDLTRYVDKTIKINYQKIKFLNIYDMIIEKEYEKNFKIVGLYQNVLSDNMDNRCFIKENVLGEIKFETKTIYSDDFLKDNYVEENSSASNVIVDKLENVTKVYNELQKANFLVTYGLEIDYSTINIFKIVSYITSGMIFIFILIITNLYIKNIIKKKKYQIGLYKSFGYNNKEINKLFVSELVMMTIFCYIISMILLLVGVIIINNILSNYITLSFLKLTISTFREILYFIVIVCLAYINVLFLSNKIYKVEVRNILNDNNN